MCEISNFFCVCCGLQDPNPTKYSIGEAIIEEIQTVSGLDGALIATMHEKQKVFVCMCQPISNFDNQLENLSIIYRSLLKPGTGRNDSGMFRPVSPTKIRNFVWISSSQNEEEGNNKRFYC